MFANSLPSLDKINIPLGPVVKIFPDEWILRPSKFPGLASASSVPSKNISDLLSFYKSILKITGFSVESELLT